MKTLIQYNALLFLMVAGALHSCQSQVFNNKEKAFTNKISSMLGGASVKYKKGIVTSSTEGKYVKLEIYIDSLNNGKNVDATQLLFAGSIPAYIFLKDNIESSVDYRYIDVVVNTNNDQIRNRYTLKQLMLVDSCIASLNGFMYGLKELNKDSIMTYGDQMLFENIDLPPMMESLRSMDIKYGKATDIILNGFRLDKFEDKDFVYFSSYLRRKGMDNVVELWVTSSTKKVIGIDL